jgi:oligopeptidase B
MPIATIAAPPIAQRREHVIASPHGGRNDPYYWLRDDERKDGEVLAYLAAENAYKEAMLAPLKPLEDKLYAEIIARLKQDDSTVPYRKNGYWYYTRFEIGKEYPIYARKCGSLDAAEEIMFDSNELAKDHGYYRIGDIEISPDNVWAAYFEDNIGRRQYALRFKNLRLGETSATRIENVEAGAAWSNDSKTLFYVEKDAETLLGVRVKKHLLGAPPASDTLVYEQPDTSFFTSVAKSKSDRFIFIISDSTVSTEYRYADAADPNLEFKVFLPRERDHEYQVEHVGEQFIVRSNWCAQNFRIMQVPIGLEADRRNWRDVMPHESNTFIEDFDVCKDFLSVGERSDGLRKIRVQAWAAKEHNWVISSEEPAYAVYIDVNPEIDSNVLRYCYSSLTTPTTIYDYNLDTQERTLLKRDPVLGPFKPEDYATEFLWAPARDGKRIPVSIVYRRDFKRDGSRPLYQYAYGAYGSSTDPVFAASRLSLLDRGFVYAIAHVRGGQELGRAWYDDGRLLAKQHSFDDFADVTRFLVASGYAAKDKVFAQGGSAGGLLMGAIANQAPALYRGILAHVPYVDVVTTMQDSSIPLTTNEYDEWGDPAAKEYYDCMLQYSPYDNVAAQDYPAIFVTTGLWDSQVQYYEPAKWIAKLRALKTNDQPLLLHINMEAGHGGKSGRFQRYRELAMEYAFVLGVLGFTD